MKDNRKPLSWLNFNSCHKKTEPLTAPTKNWRFGAPRVNGPPGYAPTRKTNVDEFLRSTSHSLDALSELKIAAFIYNYEQVKNMQQAIRHLN